MAWNDKPKPKPSPWGAAPKTPRSSPPESGPPPREPPPPRFGGRPPPLSSLTDARQLRRWLNHFLRGPSGDGLQPRAVLTILGILIGLWLLSGLYILQPDQQAVVTTFGAYSRSEGPGLRYHLPTPIERVEKVSVTALNRLDLGGTADKETPAESLMLTGDENIVDLDFSVQWRVADPADYLFNVRQPQEAVKDVAESAMRQVVGMTPLQDILTTGRGQVQTQTAELMQQILDSYQTGVTVVEVQIRSANPPTAVIQAFRDVANAAQDAESSVNEANAYRNRKINEAKGDAAKIIQAAEGYREQVVREGAGEASRFSQIYQEYRRAPAVTRQRLYIETMQRVLSRSNKVVIDAKGASAPLVLPPDVFRARAATASTGGAAIQAQSQAQQGGAQ